MGYTETVTRVTSSFNIFNLIYLISLKGNSALRTLQFKLFQPTPNKKTATYIIILHKQESDEIRYILTLMGNNRMRSSFSGTQNSFKSSLLRTVIIFLRNSGAILLLACSDAKIILPYSHHQLVSLCQ